MGSFVCNVSIYNMWAFRLDQKEKKREREGGSLVVMHLASVLVRES